MQIANSQVAIAGRVLNGKTNQAIAGAEVEIIEMPDKFSTYLSMKALQYGAGWEQMSNRPDKKVSGNDGSFFFVDLPFGHYTLAASIPNIKSQYGKQDYLVLGESPSRETNIKNIIVLENIDLSSAKISGVVTDKDDMAISFAKIQVAESLEFAFSDFEGNYLLELKASTVDRQQEITVTVSANGYQEDSETLDISALPITEKNFSLEKA